MCISLCTEKPEPTAEKIHEWEAQTCAMNDSNDPAMIDKRRHRYPFAIVWTPLPLITWLIPFIGHTGICNSQGTSFDFQGPYTIGKDRLAFGNPTRYLTLKPPQSFIVGGGGRASDVDGINSASAARAWDVAVAKANACYSRRMHDLCCDNCHSHCARALNEMAYGGFTHWNMALVCFWVFFTAPYVDFTSFLRSWLPFCLILGSVLTFVYAL
jgi:hypothetical protein